MWRAAFKLRESSPTNNNANNVLDIDLVGADGEEVGFLRRRPREVDTAGVQSHHQGAVRRRRGHV